MNLTRSCIYFLTFCVKYIGIYCVHLANDSLRTVLLHAFSCPYALFSETAMSQKRNDMEQKKGELGKNKSKVGCSYYFNGY